MLVAQNSLGPVCPVPLTVRGNDDAALRESVPSAEREKIWATDDRAEGFASGRRGLVIIQGYAREHALLDIVRERLERGSLKRERLQVGAKCRRHR